MRIKHLVMAIAAAAVATFGVFYHLNGDKNPLKKEVAPPPKSVNISLTPVQVQRLITPKLTSLDPAKILNVIVRGNHISLTLRSDDNNSASITGLNLQNNILTLRKDYGKNGVNKISGKMILDITLDDKGTIYYTKNGVHALSNGSDIISLEGKTSANKLLLLADNHSGYLYGNDNFDKVTIKDGSLDDMQPSFLKNRALPFRGGLSQLVLGPSNTLYGGGRITPNGIYLIASFDDKGKLLQKYGSEKNIVKSSIYNLTSFTVLKDYVCAIDGFTTKLWSKKGKYLGSINNDNLYSESIVPLKLVRLNDETALVLTYTRNTKTELLDLAFFTLTF